MVVSNSIQGLNGTSNDYNIVINNIYMMIIFINDII